MDFSLKAGVDCHPLPRVVLACRPPLLGVERAARVYMAQGIVAPHAGVRS